MYTNKGVKIGNIFLLMSFKGRKIVTARNRVIFNEFIFRKVFSEKGRFTAFEKKNAQTHHFDIRTKEAATQGEKISPN